MGQFTHGQGERVKIPLLPNSVGKKSVNNAGTKQGHDTRLYEIGLKKRRKICSKNNLKILKKYISGQISGLNL